MAIGYNPLASSDGLILCLDAGNPKSYPGSGSTWFDISGGNNHFTLFNNPAFNSTYFNFDGINQYARSSSTVNLSSYDSVTVEICFRVNTTTSPSGMAFEHSSDWNSQTMGFGLVPNSVGSTTYTSNSHHTNQAGGIRFDYPGVIGTDIVVHTNTWSKISDSTGRNAYINGVLQGSTATSAYSNFRNDNMFISARNGTSTFANHRVYYFKVYGKKLSSNEVTQNFNALRGRFGI